MSQSIKKKYTSFKSSVTKAGSGPNQHTTAVQFTVLTEVVTIINNYIHLSPSTGAAPEPWQWNISCQPYAEICVGGHRKVTMIINNKENNGLPLP